MPGAHDHDFPTCKLGVLPCFSYQQKYSLTWQQQIHNYGIVWYSKPNHSKRIEINGSMINHHNCTTCIPDQTVRVVILMTMVFGKSIFR